MAIKMLGNLADGTTVKLNESGFATEFIVIQQGSPSSAYIGFENGTVILRKNIHSNSKINSSFWDNDSDYENSDLNEWCNGTYLNLLDEDIRNQILTVKIPYRAGEGDSATVNSGESGLICKVFLLSTQEIDSPESYSPNEGTVMSYFKGGGNSKRIATYNNAASEWWLRSPSLDMPQLFFVYTDGNVSYYAMDYTGNYGRRPAFVLPKSLFVQDDGTIIINQPPTAPGSITADNVIGNQQAAITLTAATDPDGSVASYTYERQVDGGGWTVFATSSALTRTDPVDDSWTTVAYRAKATDNLGLSGPYATSQTYTVVHNLPPTAPGSIEATNVVSGGSATITLTAATDPDGSVASYTYERQVDGGGWTVFATSSALTRTDPVDDSWTTVAYRAKATDNLGLSGPYATSQTYTVVHNQPPTAPGSIAVSGVVRGENAAITLTAATDPDGTVASYIFERQVDGGAWQQVAQANSLTQTDTVGEDWGTVAYRACAVDNLGLAGPYITGETYTVNSGWVTIGGPAEDMGSQPRRFDFAFSVSVSGVASVDAITVSVARDGTRIYSGTPSAGKQISVPIDARLLGAGEHTIEVQASKDDYLPASRRYTFTVPAATIPDGGYGAISQASDGKTMFYTTLAQRCIGTDGVDIQAQVDALTARVKTLEG